MTASNTGAYAKVGRGFLVAGGTVAASGLFGLAAVAGIFTFNGRTTLEAAHAIGVGLIAMAAFMLVGLCVHRWRPSENLELFLVFSVILFIGFSLGSLLGSLEESDGGGEQDERGSVEAKVEAKYGVEVAPPAKGVYGEWVVDGEKQACTYLEEKLLCEVGGE